jgi:hypothetical protein
VDGHDHGALEALVEALHERRLKIRDMIIAFRDSSRQPFPNWKDSVKVATSETARVNL